MLLKGSTAPAKMECETLIDLLMSDSTDYAIVSLVDSSPSCSSLHVAATVRCCLKSKETPPMLRALPTDWSMPHQRPKLGQAIAALQAPTAGGSTQLQQEPMDVSGSMLMLQKLAHPRCRLNRSRDKQVREF